MIMMRMMMMRRRTTMTMPMTNYDEYDEHDEHDGLEYHNIVTYSHIVMGFLIITVTCSM